MIKTSWGKTRSSTGAVGAKRADKSFMQSMTVTVVSVL
jgi:hypothetical protein